MIKLASNAFLATRISFINEIANVSEAVGADVDEVVEEWARPAHRHELPGQGGYGGSCFPKDVSFLKLLAGNSGYHFQLLSAVIEVNELQKRRVVQAARAPGRPARKDDRPARSRLQAEHRRHARGAVDRPRLRLIAEGADVRPGTRRRGPSRAGRSRDRGVDARRGARADAAVIVTEWPALAWAGVSRDVAAMRTPLVVDGRNLLDPETVRAAGFDYEGIGRT